MLVCYSSPPPSIPARRHSRGIPSSSPIDSSLSRSVAAADALLFNPSKYRTDCSHHRRYTLVPGLREDRSQRSIIGRIAIYCATVFYLLVMYFLIPSNPTLTISSSNGGYYQLPYPRLLCFLPASSCAALY